MAERAPQTLIPLAVSNLAALSSVARVPNYTRADLQPGIVHIGLGNFHRAHQAWYLHRLMMTGKARNWGIIGAGVRPADAEMRARLQAQDHLTTLIELDPEGVSVEVVGSMLDYLPVEAGNAALIAQMAQPSIRIVSLTVTEGGYYRDAAGGFDADHPDMQHDAANPQTPRSCFGAMVAALRMRRDAGHGPFTALSCDNLQGNGAILRACLLGLARMQDPDLADWIEAHVSFPNSMVDCIVPATTPEVLETCRSLGIDDAAPVTHERFRQWVIEDDFCAGRPPWEEVGATLTPDVHAFESMKLRILNSGHQLLANVGELLSVPTIADCMAHEAIRAFHHKVQAEEIAPHVAAVPGFTADAYLELIERRFANPAIRDTVRRVAFDGSARHPGFLLPTLRDALAEGTAVEGLALAEALWAQMCTGQREDGSMIEPNDPHWPALQAAALEAQARPQAWLEQGQIYGDLGQNTRFAQAFASWLTALQTEGCLAVLARYQAG